MTARPRWPRRLLRLCLRTWPEDARRRDGRDLLEAVDDLLAEPRTGALSAARIVAAEGAAILVAGLALRWRALAAGIAEARSAGWTSELRYTLRALRRAPAFTAVAVVTLGSGIGANAAVLGLVDRVLLRPPPFEDPDRLMVVWSTVGRGERPLRVAGPDVAVVRERARSFASVAFVNRPADAGIVASDGAAAEPVTRAAVTPDLLAVLGIEPELGAGFDARGAPAAATPDAPAAVRTVVLSHGLWRRVFGADPRVVGHSVLLDGRAAVVTGVLPEGFRLDLPPGVGFGGTIDLWEPIPVPLERFGPGDGRRVDEDSDNTGVAVARLRTGVDAAAAEAELERVAGALRGSLPGYAEADYRLAMDRLHDASVTLARPVLLALLAGSVIVLLVMCMNVGTLLLARGIRRRPELALRIALGAGRGRVLRQLGLESVVLAALACALGWALAALLSEALWSLAPAELTLGTEAGVGWSALLGTALIGGGVALALGTAPALREGTAERRGTLGQGLLRGPASGARLRGALVVGEVALSVVLALGAGLLLRSVSALGDVRPGFEARGALSFGLSLRVPARYPGPGERARIVREIETGLSELPGVSAVGVVGALPLDGERWTKPYGLPGEAEHEWEANRAAFRVVSSGYFEAVGTRLLDGRGFTRDEDLVEARRVAIVDEALARRLAPNGTAVGAALAFPLEGSAVEATVVGVVETVRTDDLRAEGRETIYVPYRQEASRDVSFVVRTLGEPAALAPQVREAVRAIDRQLPLSDLKPMTDLLDGAVAPTRFALTLLMTFASLALVSAGVGLYGLLSYEVGRRTREIGVRVAVGASRVRVVRGVLAGGLVPCGIGLALGAAGAVVGLRSLRALLYGVGAADPATWALVLASVLAVSLAASALPAWRASRLDPTAALRAD